jgi:FemAB-related protein (PEP-CTERM system-associated)
MQSWDNYVQQHVAGTFFHLSGWKTVIEQAYGHDTCYLLAKKDEQIVGVLPLGHIKSRLFGNALISNPFCVYGGAISDDQEICAKLEKAAQKEAIHRYVDYLELRNIKKTRDDWPIKELYVTFRKEIDSDPEVNLKAIPRRQRRMVRQGIKSGLVSHIENNVETFYQIYSTSVRNHGTPVFPKKYFELLKQIFAEQCEVRLVKKNNETISAVMSFYFRDEVLPYYGGGLLAARQYNAFDFMYWDLMQTVCQQGVRIFDYGRSKIGTGSYSFKKNWGFLPEPLHYQYCLVKSDRIPEINPLNPKYQIFIKLWKRLPLPIANALGPFLARNLG